MKGFITSCGRREGSERNNDPQRVATGDLQTKDGVHVSRLPLTLECSTDLRAFMSEDTITYIKQLMKTTFISKPSRYFWKTGKGQEKKNNA